MYNLKSDDEVKILQVKSIKNIIGKGYMPDLTKQERHDLGVLSSYQVTYAHDDKHYIVFIRYTNPNSIDFEIKAGDNDIQKDKKNQDKTEAQNKYNSIMAKVDGVKLKEKNDNELSDKLKVEIVRKENHLKNIHNFKEAF